MSTSLAYQPSPFNPTHYVVLFKIIKLIIKLINFLCLCIHIRVTARCVLSVVILPITTQQCRNYLYDNS